MAIDPNVVLEGAKEAGKTIRDGVREYGKAKQKETEEKGKTKRREAEETNKTKRHSIDAKSENEKEYEKTKQKKTEETHKTERHSIDAEKDNKESQIQANQEAANNVKSIADKSVSGSFDIIKDTTDKVAEVGNKSVDHVKEMANALDQKLSAAHERHQKHLEDKDRKINEYQGLLQNASIQVAEHRITEKIRNEMSQKVLNFAETVASYHEKIRNTEYDLNREKMNLQPLQDELRLLQTKVKVLESRCEELNYEFEKKNYLLDELRHDYRDSMDESKYREIHQRKERELNRLLDDIHHKESEFLSREQDRLNKIEEMEPIFQAIDGHEIAFEYLKNEHTRLVTVGTLKLSNLQIENNNATQDGGGDIVDAQVVGESKSDKLLTNDT